MKNTHVVSGPANAFGNGTREVHFCIQGGSTISRHTFLYPRGYNYVFFQNELHSISYHRHTQEKIAQRWL